jgi:mono/diheme cytochrome c family protein
MRRSVCPSILSSKFNASVAAIALLAAAILYGCASHESVAQVEPPKSFTPEQIAKGRELAHVGNCMGCHTAEGGTPYAGGTPLKTPFGTIHGTNITPDPETGIGRWSLEAFTRAMREGVDREGRHLFPAFPYDHFTKATDEDIAALYAFVMTREPVKQRNLRNSVPLPRASVAFWKSKYFEPGIYKPDPARSAEWNRGAYLVEGLGHCGACHTPRNKLGAEEKARAFAGGEVEGWHAPALNSASPSPVPWTVEALQAYLRHGTADLHSISAGPMAEVVHDLSQVNEADLRALATYVVSLDARNDDERRRAREMALERARNAVAVQGNAIYDGACADCHNRGREQEGGALQLPLGTALTIPTPRNLAYIIRDGIVPHEGERGGWMPAYAGGLTDEQLTELLIYLRALSGRPAWTNVDAEVRKISKGQ